MSKSWMDEELTRAIIQVFERHKKAKRTATYGKFADDVIKQYSANKKRFKAERKKWIDDNWKENAKELLKGIS